MSLIKPRWLLGALFLTACGGESPPNHSQPDREVKTTIARWQARFGSSVLSKTVRSTREPLKVRLGDSTQQPTFVEASQGSVALGFRLLGASNSRALVDGVDAVYPGAAPGGGSVLVRSLPDSVEDFVELVEPLAEPELAYELDVSRVAGLRSVSGVLEVLDAGGAPRLVALQPFVIDARGERHEAHFEVRDCRVDRDPGPPTRRPVVTPGQARCRLLVKWPREVDYPILVDPSWQSAGNMLVGVGTYAGRVHFTLTDVGSNKLLAVGGLDGTTTLSSTSWYDANAKIWSVGPSMKTARARHAATLRPNDNELVVTGGIGQTGNFLGTGEALDLTSNKWSTFTMPAPRADHEAMRNPAGSDVVLVGGINANGELDKADIYNPSVLGTFYPTVTGPTRVGHALLQGTLPGEIAVLGGFTNGAAATDSYLIYNVGTRKFTVGKPMMAGRGYHAAMRRATGTMIVAGGRATVDGASLRSVESFDGSAWKALPEIDFQRSRLGGVALTGDTLLVAGGELCVQPDPKQPAVCTPLLSTEALPSGAGSSWASAGGLIVGRVAPEMLPLAGNKALIAGGTNFAVSLASAELFTTQTLGGACSFDGECPNGICAQGVCCLTACSGSCMSCDGALTGASSGQCQPVKAGLVDPTGTCKDQGPASCKTNAQCDGAGGCALYASATPCAPPLCKNDSIITLACDGNGSCVEQTPLTCAPNQCEPGNNGCGAACSTDANCAATAWCNSGICVPKSQNAAECVDGASCLSGLCADDVCCNAKCEGQCEACDVGASTGICTPVVGKPHAPRPDCAGPSASDPCTEALCDGSDRDKCAGHVGAGVSCREASCVSGSATEAAECNGGGQCPGAKTHGCDPYVCGADACLSQCASNADCQSPSFCDEKSKKCVSGATCQDDHHTSVLADGTLQDCSPYTCDGDGSCLNSCKSTLECIEGTACTTSQVCVPTDSAPTDEGGGCGCSTPGRSRSGLEVFGLLAALFLLQRRSSRR